MRGMTKLEGRRNDETQRAEIREKITIHFEMTATLRSFAKKRMSGMTKHEGRRTKE
jgi:hypothetical protein